MRKKYIKVLGTTLFAISLLFSLTSCFSSDSDSITSTTLPSVEEPTDDNKPSESLPTPETDDEKLDSLLKNFKSDNFSFIVKTTDDDFKVQLESTGKINKLENGNFLYEYKYQYLNKIGSGNPELVGEISDKVEGTLDEIKKSESNINYSGLSSLNLIGFKITPSLLKTRELTDIGDNKILIGELDTKILSVIIEGIDLNQQYNYSLIINDDISQINKLNIEYKTNIFEKVLITFNF